MAWCAQRRLMLLLFACRAWCEVAWQRYGYTALLLSCENEHTDIVRVLLDRPDVDVWVANVSGAGSRWTNSGMLLHFACHVIVVLGVRWHGRCMGTRHCC